MAEQATRSAGGRDLLAEAVNAAVRGDDAGARKLAEEGLRTSGDPTSFHAFLGMLFARAGDYAMAADHLRLAHTARPNDVTTACNLISVLISLDASDEALGVASADLAWADQSLRVARYRGFLAQKLSLFDAAIEAYEFVLSRRPDDFECWNNLGNARAGVGDHDGAVAALLRAVELDKYAAPTRLNLASALVALERNAEAAAALRQAADDFPEDSRPSYQLYVLHKRAEEQDQAILALEEAARRDPNIASIQLKLGIEYGIVRRPDDSERAYRRTIVLNPQEVDAYLGLAVHYEHTNRESEFKPLLALAKANEIGDGPCAFIEALDLRRAKRFAEALACVERVPPEIEPYRTAHIKATLLDRLGRADEAFAAFSAANRLLVDTPTAPLDRAAALRSELREEIRLLTAEWAQSWRAAAPVDEHADPVFLVGFPRSGTTLLDTILMGHPATTVLEEEPPLNIVERELGGLAALPDLDEEAVLHWRARYFAEVDAIAKIDGKMLIDKSPLFLHRAPLIRRLFPNARIILAMRHPYDVVLSCFMSNFRLNSAMANFLRLEDAAAFYDLCFTHWRVSAALFPTPTRTIYYERLVDDVEAEVTPLLDWLGLSRDPSVFDHQKTAKSRGLITTASYSQVTEPIYKRASGRWERYRRHLEPALDVIAPWAEYFGYGCPKTSDV